MPRPAPSHLCALAFLLALGGALPTGALAQAADGTVAARGGNVTLDFANGERFDMNELTAAHKTLPFGTRVLVHNPRTGKEVVVRINDRGPFIKGRMIDLSKAAAKALGFKSRGHDAVVLREVLPARADGELVASGRDS